MWTDMSMAYLSFFPFPLLSHGKMAAGYDDTSIVSIPTLQRREKGD
jgi:hypothetical protein